MSTMHTLGAIDPDCAYIPFTGSKHTTACDPVAHTALCMEITTIVDPPIYRAVVGNHTYCALLPCADCR